MSAPSDETNHCSSRLKLRFVSASVIPATERSSASIFNKRSMFCSTETVNGSILYGVAHSATMAFSGASRTFSFFTRAEARAISTACADVASTAPRPSSADAANPHAPSAITRTLMPTDSASEALRNHAHVSVACPALRGDVQRPIGNMFHGGDFNLTQGDGVPKTMSVVRITTVVRESYRSYPPKTIYHRKKRGTHIRDQHTCPHNPHKPSLVLPQKASHHRIGEELQSSLLDLQTHTSDFL